MIAAHKARFGVRELLQVAYAQDPNEKAALFRVIGDIADEGTVPELIARMEGKDPIARVHVISILSKFNLPRRARSPAKTAERSQQADSQRRAWGPGAHGRPDRRPSRVRIAARSGNRGPEQGDRPRDQGSRSENHSLSRAGDEGRKRVRAPRRGRGVERDRRRFLGQGSANSHCGR